ncbi:MAG: hypothetical protein A2908_04270 [Candidatus Staskawiczbacteria bacterium RIFCSPLOWO2_01_FULL_38_12b]|uniref:Uncharacterized protein n=1 Tax=Candidatus Staskawiczbacteria bacterium RIFCSPLOWO2_01_FULL_38_12b TaxID=1802214 RepID=A0A1G2IH25_9BACT|nr:MAG: hypothetical protein A2908_04270 [Candidatus Staskawiczbacteria bacterium RIFCSPLOWO2_01_FULL_38_12b]
MQLSNKKSILIVVFCLSLLCNAVLALLLVNNVYAQNRANQTQQLNLKILSFTNVFIEQVLMSDKDVDFNTRLTLETMVRNLNDQDILDQWQSLTQAQDNRSASVEAKKLLNVLVKKISY